LFNSITSEKEKTKVDKQHFGYMHLVSFEDDEFIAGVAYSEKEACELVEAGFEYVCDFNGNKIFRKRK